jgi:hypothetical protein
MEGFIGSMLILFGVIGALSGAIAWSLARKQLEWEPVEGSVCVSDVQFNSDFYQPRIEYTYSYRGRAFRGQKVRSFSLMVNWRGPAQRDVARYPLGSTVTVFVNPANPWDPVLERGGDRRFLVFILSVSAILLMMGLLALGSRGKQQPINEQRQVVMSPDIPR